MNKYYTPTSIVYHDGQFTSPEKLGADLYSQTLHYGNGIFEGIRSYRTNSGASIFKAKEHYERMMKGARLMDLPFEYGIDELIGLTSALLEKNRLEDAYIRPLLCVGANMSLSSSQESVLTIQCWKWPKFMGENLLKVMTSSFQRPNPKSCFVEAKVTGHYVNSILATNEAKAAGYDECLLLDMHGNVAESSGANIFIEKNGKLFTPSKGHIMAGITRDVVIDLAKAEGIEVREGIISLDELKDADSAFFTGTAAEVIGLGSIDDYQFPKEWEKSLGYRIMNLYVQETRGDYKRPSV